ncbi:MAG: hypothetical protein J7521_21020 [Caulobacter sp.]|nr:hypothetical protein [Caulobacter sp.]
MSALVGTAPRINTPGSRTGGKPRSGVRRDSRPADAARSFWRAMDKDQVVRMMKVARHYAEAHRKKGVAPLTPATLKVLETLLFKALDWATGKLDWSYLQIAEASGRSVDSVWRAILQLEAGGWLERMRRCEPNPDPAPGAPPWRQITNAYRLDLPKKVRLWWQSIGIRNRRAPVSADLEHDQVVRAGERALMEPQNDRMMGEREIERRKAQRAASQAAKREAQPNLYVAANSASTALPGPGRETQAEMAARLYAAAEARSRSSSADSEDR